MSDAQHQCFTVSSTAYVRNLDLTDREDECIAVHYEAAPVKNDDGTTSHGMIYPVLIMSHYLSNRQETAEKVARILNKHWDDEE